MEEEDDLVLDGELGNAHLYTNLTDEHEQRALDMDYDDFEENVVNA